MAVHQRAVQVSQALAVAFHRYNRWDDGSQMYDADGYILPNQKMREHGISFADLRPLGIVPDWNQANLLATRLVESRKGSQSR